MVNKCQAWENCHLLSCAACAAEPCCEYSAAVVTVTRPSHPPSNHTPVNRTPSAPVSKQKGTPPNATRFEVELVLEGLDYPTTNFQILEAVLVDALASDFGATALGA